MLGSSIVLAESSHTIAGTYLWKVPKSKNFIKLDITDMDWIEKVLIDFNPDAIIHTAAMTNVDDCEKDPDYAKLLHVDGTKNILEISKEMGTYFVYISTDSVFDGMKGNYVEDDKPNPLNTYAKTKYHGEQITLGHKNTVVIRTNIYGYNWLDKQSIGEWILFSLRDNKKINLFHDVYFCPILVNNLTEILIEICEKRLTGVYHIAGVECVSKLEFGRRIAKIFELNEKLIKPISISELNLLAPRPLKPTLNCSKIQKETETKLLSVNEGLKCFKKLENSGYLDRLKNL